MFVGLAGVVDRTNLHASGKCTLAIVMLGFFPPGSLPGQDTWGPDVFVESDVATFEDLWISADMIETCCLQQHRIPGWAAQGESSGARVPNAVRALV